MEEGLLFYGVALHTADVAPGDVQGSATVVANLADSGLTIRDRTAVPTGETAHPVAVKFLVKLALADVLVNDVTQGRHILSPKSADFHTPFYRKGGNYWARLRLKLCPSFFEFCLAGESNGPVLNFEL